MSRGVTHLAGRVRRACTRSCPWALIRPLNPRASLSSESLHGQASNAIRWQLQARPSLGVRAFTQLPATPSGEQSASDLKEQVAPLIRNAPDEALEALYSLVDGEVIRRQLEAFMPESLRERYPEGEIEVMDAAREGDMTVVFPGMSKPDFVEYRRETWTKHGMLVECVEISIGYVDDDDPDYLSWSLGSYADNEEGRVSDGWSTVRKIISEVDPEGEEGGEVIMWLLRALHKYGGFEGEREFEEDLTEALMRGDDDDEDE